MHPGQAEAANSERANNRGGGGMSSRRRRSWPAFRSDRRVLAFVPGNDRGSVGSKAVGKPDKTPLFDLVRKHFWAPGTILRPLQSCLQTALLRIKRPSITELQPTRCFSVRGNGAFPKTCAGLAAQELRLDPPLPDTRSCLLAHACSRTVILRTKVSTIVARFDPGVVIFLFHGRNSGQQKTQSERLEPRVRQLGANLGRRSRSHVSDCVQQCSVAGVLRRIRKVF
jgi:hypothetical protein